MRRLAALLFLAAALLSSCTGELFVCEEYAIVYDNDGLPRLFGGNCELWIPLPEGEIT